ncbi:hypothetical protein PSACC_01831 [Paramicrosporidium saccamoebae]|uniref:Uncharacterized protein n=1 Tax=Paramicrosporidium saccamoebae TaxID=1246581 RepID=A0A2H9TKQ5_9FUNG|nr:hypothetical protein PSACC_01831 [Paramicrosporidium saccamoebae]
MRLAQITILAAICLFGVAKGDDFFEMLFGTKPLNGKLGESSVAPEESSKPEATSADAASSDAANADAANTDAADTTVTSETDATNA